MDITKATFESTAGVQAMNVQGLRDGEERVFSHFAAGSSVLDMGCGTGRTTAVLKDRGFRVTGMDYSAAMIREAASQRPDIQFDVMDASEMTYGDASFDNAFFSYNGLGNLYPERLRLKALSEIHRILRAGGIFAYTSHRLIVPNTLGRIKNDLASMMHGYVYPYHRTAEKGGDVVMIGYRGSVSRQMEQLKAHGFELVDFFTAKDDFYVCRKV
jgi:ubiquinone/menaquinone biosynthesis C-methylase UbiE